MKLTPTFAEMLKQKLTTGNSRSILLNATPGRLVSRLPLTDLNIIKSDLGDQFFSILTSQRTFSFKVTINFGGRTEDNQAKLARIGKRMSSIKFDHDDYLKEHGVETFGFGFPVLIRQNPKDSTKVIAAPVFVFPLGIRQSFDKPNEWIISRDGDSEIRVNEVLASFLENEEHVKMPSIPEEMLEDGVLDETELKTLCKELLSKFQETASAFSIDSTWAGLEPFPEKANKTEKINPGKVLWNGVFGIYKSQKQNLIREMDLLLSDFDNLMQEQGGELGWDNSHSPMKTDPSQNGVLRSLQNSRNVVIQGPPGTGKSQTLTAIVSSALANKKKVLVVCEKRTALEVLKSNLEKLIPDAKKAIALIEDVSRDRSTIVETVRGRTAAFLTNQQHLQKVLKEDIFSFEYKARVIDLQYSALKEPIWRNMPWPDLVSQWIRPKRHEDDTHKLYQLQRVFHQDRTTDDGYISLYRVIEEAAILFNKTKPQYSFFQSSLRLPLILGNGHHREIIHVIKDNYYKIDSLLTDIELLKTEIRENSTAQIAALISTTVADLKELSTIVNSAKNTGIDIYQLPFKAKLLALFSKRWKAMLHNSERAKTLRKQLQVYWKQIFNKPFVLDDLGVQSKLIADQHPLLAEILYKDLLQCQSPKNKLKQPARFNTIVTIINDVQNSLQEIVMERLVSLNNESIEEVEQTTFALKQKLQIVLRMEDDIGYFISWKIFYRKLSAFETKWIEVLVENSSDRWLKIIEDAWLYYRLLEQDQDGKYPTDDSSLRILRDLGLKIQKNQERLINQNLEDWFVSGQKRIKQLGLQVNQLYNLRGSKGSTRNSLRKIVHADISAFTDFFPVLMLNPSTCSSLLPLLREYFDLVIFDEASQLRIEDTFTALLRGRQVVVSGDSQQMPPSSYFSSSTNLVEDDTDNNDESEENENETSKLLEDAAKEMSTKESLLEFAIDAGYMQTYLDMHYRSKHPDLIEFSNVCFYNSRLVPMPEKSSERPIQYIHVNGLYEDHTNRKEAEQIIRLLKEEIDEKHSIGIATFNLTQRNLILTLIGEERINDKAFHNKMTVFEDNGFFVKNLENIQGDEKDIIFISTTFGVKSDGKFLMNFGPIGNQNGHKLFNVIITRAKVKVYVLTSIPENKISDYRGRLEVSRKVDGRTALMAYLDYSRAVSNNNDAEKTNILEFIRSKVSLGRATVEGALTGLTESPFEEEVYSWLAEAIGADRVKLQYKCGGFRIDMVVFPKSGDSKVKLAIECDGAAYHSDQLSWHYDIYRQDQLEQEGFIFRRIWSTNWWRKPEKEFEHLLKVISELN